MNNSPFQPRPLWQWAILIGLLGFPIAHFGLNYFRRPPQQPLTKALFEGIRYQRMVRADPRPMMIHIVTLDLKQAGLKPLVTPSNPAVQPEHTQARTTTHFLKEFGLRLPLTAVFSIDFERKHRGIFIPRRAIAFRPLVRQFLTQSHTLPSKKNIPPFVFQDSSRLKLWRRGLVQLGRSRRSPEMKLSLFTDKLR
jgi:hypothetical protein